MDTDAPTQENAGQASSQNGFKSGNIYLVKADTPKYAFRSFARLSPKGGLAITRKLPTQVKEDYGLGDGVEMYWLSTNQGGKVKTIPPTKLMEVINLVDTFVKKGTPEQPIPMILEGLEFLVTQNQWLTTLRTINFIYEKVSTNYALLLLPVRPDALEPLQLANLEVECKPLGPMDVQDLISGRK